MSAGGGRQDGGFTLVELLVSISILLVIGGVAAGVMLTAFRLWEHGCRRGRSVAAEAEFHERGRRDFASAIAGRGFEGDAGGCRFWVLAVTNGRPAVVPVAWRVEGSGLERLSGEPPAVERVRLAPLRRVTFAYDAGGEAAAWTPSWETATNAPVRLRLSGIDMDGRPWEQIFVRRMR